MDLIGTFNNMVLEEEKTAHVNAEANTANAKANAKLSKSSITQSKHHKEAFSTLVNTTTTTTTTTTETGGATGGGRPRQLIDCLAEVRAGRFFCLYRPADETKKTNPPELCNLDLFSFRTLGDSSLFQTGTDERHRVGLAIRTSYLSPRTKSILLEKPTRKEKKKLVSLHYCCTVIPCRIDMSTSLRKEIVRC